MHTFSAFLSQSRCRVLGAFLAVGWLGSSIVIGSRSRRVRRKSQHVRRRPLSNLHSLHAQIRHLRPIPSEHRYNPETTLPLGWHRLSLPFARHARMLVQTCLPADRSLLVRRSFLLNLVRQSFWPAQTTNSELHCYRQHARHSVYLFVRMFIGLTVPIFPSSSYQEVDVLICSDMLPKEANHSLLKLPP